MNRGDRVGKLTRKIKRPSSENGGSKRKVFYEVQCDLHGTKMPLTKDFHKSVRVDVHSEMGCPLDRRTES